MIRIDSNQKQKCSRQGWERMNRNCTLCINVYIRFERSQTIWVVLILIFHNQWVFLNCQIDSTILEWGPSWSMSPRLVMEQSASIELKSKVENRISTHCSCFFCSHTERLPNRSHVLLASIKINTLLHEVEKFFSSSDDPHQKLSSIALLC